ncbi:serine protein kinase RIO [Candidatus Woesearchaeota archaeon]|jgi:RIO kinase 1|nr:serine protein kinase RIO [Candidatus Woesearchaeota archaeon]
MAKITREKFKTWGNVFDQFTLRNLFELSSKGHFLEVKSPVSIGKEANVFTAETKQGKLIIVKIYRLETCDFNKMYDYIKYDARYLNLKAKRREIIFSWAQREFRNLMKAREAGVRVPLPIQCKNNILLMEYIGDAEPAPKLKDAYPDDPEKFASKIIDYMKKLYKAQLVHGDLSEFNILNWNEKPVFIDISQGTITRSMNAEELLERDIKNMCRFFKKIGVEKGVEEVKGFITS